MEALFELNDRSIDLVSKLQRFTYRCISMFGPVQTRTFTIERKRELMNKWATDLFKDYEFKLIFDETIWRPDMPALYGNLVDVYVKSSPGGEIIMHNLNLLLSDHSIFRARYEGHYQQLSKKFGI